MFVVLFCIGLISAQTFPNGINYQAIARDANGNAIANQQVPVQFSIYQHTSNGTLVCQERQLRSTNSMGQFTAILGNGAPVSPSNATTFSQINWGADSTFLKVEINSNVCYTGSFTQIGNVSKMQAVPYAMNSNSTRDKQNLSYNASTGELSIDNGGNTKGNNVTLPLKEIGCFQELYSYAAAGGNPGYFGLGGSKYACLSLNTWTGTTGNNSTITGYIPLNTSSISGGTDITFNASTGLITLAAGTYHIAGTFLSEVSVTGGWIEMRKRLIDQNNNIYAVGTAGGAYVTSGSQDTRISSEMNDIIVIPQGGATIKVQRYFATNGVNTVYAEGISFTVSGIDEIISKICIEKIN